MEIQKEITQKVAHLSRLELTSDELESFTSQLRKILEHISLLNEVQTTGVEPMVQPWEMVTYLREDEPQEMEKNSLGTPFVLESAPEVLYDSYKVPPII